MQRYQVLDEITLLVDKSLVMADDNSGRTCYRLCETMRHYALEKLSEAGEVDAVFARHRDYYTALAARVDNPGPSDYSHCLDQAETEIDNLRAAFVEPGKFRHRGRLGAGVLPVAGMDDAGAHPGGARLV